MATKGVGDELGELGLLSGATLTADVVTLTPCELAVLWCADYF